MKFILTTWIYTDPNTTKDTQHVTGWTNLPDVCTAALSISQARAKQANPPTIAIWVKVPHKRHGEMLAVAQYEYDTTAALQLRCETALQKVRNEQKAQRQRDKFAHAIIKAGNSEFYTNLMANETARQAFHNNDFKTVLQILDIPAPSPKPQAPSLS